MASLKPVLCQANESWAHNHHDGHDLSRTLQSPMAMYRKRVPWSFLCREMPLVSCCFFVDMGRRSKPPTAEASDVLDDMDTVQGLGVAIEREGGCPRYIADCPSLRRFRWW
jgi:hypothetical protein